MTNPISNSTIPTIEVPAAGWWTTGTEAVSSAISSIGGKISNAAHSTLNAMNDGANYVGESCSALKGRVVDFAASVRSHEYLKGSFDNLAVVMPFVGGAAAGALSTHAVINLAKAVHSKNDVQKNDLIKLAAAVAFASVSYAAAGDDQVKTLAISATATAVLTGLAVTFKDSISSNFQALKDRFSSDKSAKIA